MKGGSYFDTFLSPSFFPAPPTSPHLHHVPPSLPEALHVNQLRKICAQHLGGGGRRRGRAECTWGRGGRVRSEGGRRPRAPKLPMRLFPQATAHPPPSSPPHLGEPCQHQHQRLVPLLLPSLQFHTSLPVHTLVSPASTSTSVSSHCFCSVLRLWCISILTERPPGCGGGGRGMR